MKNIIATLLILSVAISACSAVNQSTPSVNANPTSLPESISTVVSTQMTSPTAVPTKEEKWKVINSIATEDKPVEVRNSTDYWEMALTRGVQFSSELQIRVNMKPKGDAGIILTGTQAGSDQWWQGYKLLALSYEGGYFNIVLRDGVQEEPVYNNSIPMPLHDGAIGEITITFGRQGKYIKIERNDKTIDRIIPPDLGDFPDGLFAENRILEVFLSSGARSSVQLTEMEFLIPAFEFTPEITPLIPADLQAPEIGGGLVAIASWGELILLNHPGSGRSIPETQVDSMNSARFWTRSENERLILASDFIPRNLAWSPNGQHLTFTNFSQQGNDTSYFPYGLYDYDMSTDPAKLNEVVGTSTKVNKFAWSPDGQSLAYIKIDASGSSYLFIASPPNYSDERQITDYNVYDFTWSPNGSQLAIVASPPTRTNHVQTGYILNLSDFAITKLTGEPYKYIWNPRWSPDGKLIAFVNGYTQGVDLYYVSDIVYETSTLSFLQEFKNEWVSWSPDGNHAIRSGLVTLFLCDSDLSNEKTIYDFTNKPRDFFVSTANWSPDSQHVAYNLELFDANRTYSLNFLDLDSSIREITTRPGVGRHGEWASTMSWSPDNKYLLFLKYENDQYNLYTADVKSGDISLFAYDLNDVVLEAAWQP
jgi:Tol biopolymer transport system component